MMVPVSVCAAVTARFSRQGSTHMMVGMAGRGCGGHCARPTQNAASLDLKLDAQAISRTRFHANQPTARSTGLTLWRRPHLAALARPVQEGRCIVGHSIDVRASLA
jgi:hypothetical protein